MDGVFYCRESDDKNVVGHLKKHKFWSMILSGRFFLLKK